MPDTQPGLSGGRTSPAEDIEFGAERSLSDLILAYEDKDVFAALQFRHPLAAPPLRARSPVLISPFHTLPA